MTCLVWLNFQNVIILFDCNQVNLFILLFFIRVQVRRTDKINTEAAFHSIEEYMYWVDLYYNKLARVQAIEKRRVYLATDDPNLLPEAKEK